MNDLDAVLKKRGIDKVVIVLQDPDSNFILTKKWGDSAWAVGALIMTADEYRAAWVGNNTEHNDGG